MKLIIYLFSNILTKKLKLLSPHQSKSSLQVKHFVKNNGHV